MFYKPIPLFRYCACVFRGVSGLSCGPIFAATRTARRIHCFESKIGMRMQAIRFDDSDRSTPEFPQYLLWLTELVRGMILIFGIDNSIDS